MKIYNDEEIKSRLKELDDHQAEIDCPLKWHRVRSLSPILHPERQPSPDQSFYASSPHRSSPSHHLSPQWDIEHGLSLPMDD